MSQGATRKARAKRFRTGDVAAVLRMSKTAPPTDSPTHRKRTLVAQLCRLIGSQLGQTQMPTTIPAKLSPRMRQTLQLLLSGCSEKEVAAKLGLSVHTVHVYVKSIHKQLGVSSRGELLARCLKT